MVLFDVARTDALGSTSVGFFRRSEKRETGQRWTVGVNNHRVVVGSHERGVVMLPELRGYVASVTGGAAQKVDGRDPVAVLSAKMDQAELVNDACAAVALAFEDLGQRGLVDPADVPPSPELPPVPARGAHYDYIQTAHRRALARLDWLESCDGVLAARGIAVMNPVPVEDPALHPLTR